MSYFVLNQTTLPSAPAASKNLLYASSVNGRLYYLDAAGWPHDVSSGGISCTTGASGSITIVETAVGGGNAINGGTFLLPANTLKVGSCIRFTALGTVAVAVAASTSSFKIKWGALGTASDTVTPLTTGNITSSGVVAATPFRAVFEMAVRSIGSGTTATAYGAATIETSGSLGIAAQPTTILATGVGAGFDTTTQNYMTLTFTGTANVTGVFQHVYAEVVR